MQGLFKHASISVLALTLMLPAAAMAQNVRERELLLARAKACASETAAGETGAGEMGAA